MTILVIGPGFESADSMLLLAMLCLAFAVIGLWDTPRQVQEDAAEWRRLCQWLPTAASYINKEYQEWHPNAIVQDLLRRARPEFAVPCLDPDSVLARAARGRLVFEISECQWCGREVRRADRNSPWKHTAGGVACSADSLHFAAPQRIRQPRRRTS